MIKKKSNNFALLGAWLLSACFASAGDAKLVIDDKQPIEDAYSLCDIFDKNTLYKGDGFIKSVKLQGRYHGQYISEVEDINGVRADGYHVYSHRRARLQTEVKMANNLKFGADANISDGDGARTGLVRDQGPEMPLIFGPVWFS